MAEAELLAEVDRLRHENDVLRAMFDRSRHQIADAVGAQRGYGWTSLADEIRQTTAEVDRLRAEVERLQAALLDSVPKRFLTREQQLEATLRQHLAGVGQGAAK
jgi:50S ribosomal subunit-associated GTPase HflX